MTGRRILVADDQPDAAHALSALLTNLGHDVRVAHDGREAVRVAADFAPEIAILDIDMPSLDGLDTARALRDRDPDVLLVAVTGLPPFFLPANALEDCFDRQYDKPISAAALAALMEVVAEDDDLEAAAAPH